MGWPRAALLGCGLLLVLGPAGVRAETLPAPRPRPDVTTSAPDLETRPAVAPAAAPDPGPAVLPALPSLPEPGGLRPPPASPPATPAGEEPYRTIAADVAAGSASNAFWALTVGFVLHGTGHYLAGEREAALLLLATEAAGLLLVGAAELTDSLSGESRRLAPFTRPVAALGLAAFVTSWELDLLGTFTGQAGTARYQELPPEPLTGSVYYALWSDPVQNHLNLFSLGLRVPLGRIARPLSRVELAAHGSWDPFDSSLPLLLGGVVSLRLVGGPAQLASRVVLDLEWSEELRASQGYGVSTPACSLEVRYNLGQALSRFRQVLLLARWGYGLEVTHFLASSYAFDLQGDRRPITIGEVGLSLPLTGTSRLDLRWRLLNDRLILAGQPGRAPYHAGFAFQIGGPMDLLLSFNLGMGVDGWLGLAYRYY